MKNLLASTALLLAAAIPAAAMTSATDLTKVEKGTLSVMVPGADLDNLTTDQVRALRAALNNGDDSNQRTWINGILR